MSDGPAAVDRLRSLWRQIARRYRSADVGVAYDVLNEPRGGMTSARWNALLPDVVASIREVDRSRVVIIGGAEMSTVAGLTALTVPADEHLVLTLHYYEPFRFTHQGASWEPGSADWSGTTWGTVQDRGKVTTDLERASSWAERRGHALYVGEFGAIGTADATSRAAWTQTVRTEAERLGLSWAYWDYRTDFGLYDGRRDRWQTPVLDALLG